MLLEIITWILYVIMILVGLFLLYVIRNIDTETMDKTKPLIKYHLKKMLPLCIIMSLLMLPTKEEYIIYITFLVSFGSYKLGVVAQMIYDDKETIDPP